MQTLDVSYRQLAVFHSRLSEPFNGWRDADVLQGFAWRPQSVSFQTLDDGEMKVEVLAGIANVTYRPDAIRIIRVPFAIDGEVEVATITEQQTLVLSVKSGDYALTFEHGVETNGVMWCRLWLVEVAVPVSPEILKADEEMRPSWPLLMDATAATSRR